MHNSIQTTSDISILAEELHRELVLDIGTLCRLTTELLTFLCLQQWSLLTPSIAGLSPDVRTT